MSVNLFLFFFFNFNFYFILLYNTVLVLPYIDMNPPWVYMSSQTWTPLPPATPYHLSGSSPCTSPKHPVSCIKHRLANRFLHDSIHVSVPFSQILPPSPSPTESKSPFYTSVSLLLECNSHSLQGRLVSQTATGSLSVGIDAPSLACGRDRAPRIYNKNECGA